MISKTKKTILAFFTLFFCSSFLFAVPSPGGKGRIGAYNSPMSHSRATSNISFPYPSNKWYGSIFTGHNHHAYSFKMSPSPMTINLNTNPSGSAAGKGYLIGYPSLTYSADYVKNNGTPVFFARVTALKAGGSGDEISSSGSVLDGYSDWSATFIVKDGTDNTKWIKTTIGKGFIFTYNEFSEGLNPKIVSYSGSAVKVFDAGGNEVAQGTYQTDRLLLRAPASNETPDDVIYFAVYAPQNASFTVSSSEITVSFASDDRYLSVALINKGANTNANKNNAVAIFNEYYKYAYNFITDTKVSYSFDKTNSKVTTAFEFTTSAKRSGADFASGTVFALFPHQWKNASAATSSLLKPDIYNFKTLRGVMKVGAGASFATENKFFGILPNLTYEVPASLKNAMQAYINNDRNFSAQANASDTYYSGKALAKAANLIPILHQFGDIDGRNRMIEKLKTQLKLWYTYSSGQAQKYFAYDSNWGGLIGIPYAFGSENYADHHFHYGYFIYASAILSLFDVQFASSDEYKGIVDLLVKDIYNHSRGDSYFPFLRHFDVYEGHSWANGAGGGDDRGIDQESSSEAMNAWAGVYLWGLASDNPDLINLGAYGYTTEYEASKEYFLDMSGEIYGGTPYAHKGVGILWDNEAVYDLHFTPKISQTIKGIQLLPLTPSMLYLGYDASYAQSYYSEMLANQGDPAGLWKDIWLRYKALYDAPGALNDFVMGGFSAEEGSSLTYSFQFINFFNAYGSVDTSAAADNESFCVMNKSGQKSYIAFNASTDSYKTVSFKSVPTGALAGDMQVPPMTTAVTKDFVNFKYDSLRTMHCEGNSYVLLTDLYSDGCTVAASTVPAINQTYYKSIPFVFSVSAPAGFLNDVKTYVKLSNITVPSGYSAGDIKLAFYSPQAGLPESTYPSQNITVETENAATATVLIEAELKKTGTYVLVIPTGVPHPGLKRISGTIKNAKDGSDVSAAMHIYNSVDGSTSAAVFDGSYEMQVIKGESYLITLTADGFAFEPESYYFTVGDSDIVRDFSALAEYELSGTVLFKLKGLDKINVSIYDVASGSTRTVMTAGGGKYRTSVYYGKSYMVTPASSEYDFINKYMYFDNIAAPVTLADFQAIVAAGRFVAYPNPYKPAEHGNCGITFSGLKSGAEIKIYNIAGELVFDKKAPADGSYIWYAENDSGYQIASGVYIYYIRSGGKTHKGKVAVER